MTAKELQETLPEAVAAKHVAIKAGIKPKTWSQMVWREKVLSSDQREQMAKAMLALATQCAQVAAELKPNSD